MLLLSTVVATLACAAPILLNTLQYPDEYRWYICIQCSFAQAYPIVLMNVKRLAEVWNLKNFSSPIVQM
jgi:hypothetical protein